MSDGSYNWAGVLITVIVAAAVATVVIIVMDEMAGVDWNEEVCDVKYDDKWEYVNGSQDLDNQTIVCEAPNGTQIKTDRELNLTSASVLYLNAP